MQVAVSFLKSKYSLDETLSKIEDTSCDYIHVDVMDGIYVDNKTPQCKESLSKCVKPLDIHLMCAYPLEYIKYFQDLNPEYITIHLDIKEDLKEVIKFLKSNNIKVGLALKLDQNLQDLEPYLKICDQILVMSVSPGYGGQPFQAEALEIIKTLKSQKDNNNYTYTINVDGGINEGNIKQVISAGADMVVSGSYVCMSQDYEEKVESLKS